MRIFCLVSLLALSAFAARASSQSSEPTSGEYHAALSGASKGSLAWEETVDRVDIDKIDISYAAGKTFVQLKHNLHQALKNLRVFATDVLREDTLAGEVVFLSSLQEVQSQLEGLSALAADFPLSDTTMTKRLNSWSLELETLASGSVQTAYLVAFPYTVNRAHEADLKLGNSVGGK